MGNLSALNAGEGRHQGFAIVNLRLQKLDWISSCA